MAKKPAITGLHSQGIVDDIAKAVVKKVARARYSGMAKQVQKSATKAKPVSSGSTKSYLKTQKKSEKMKKVYSKTGWK